MSDELLKVFIPAIVTFVIAVLSFVMNIISLLKHKKTYSWKKGIDGSIEEQIAKVSSDLEAKLHKTKKQYDDSRKIYKTIAKKYSDMYMLLKDLSEATGSDSLNGNEKLKEESRAFEKLLLENKPFIPKEFSESAEIALKVFNEQALNYKNSGNIDISEFVKRMSFLGEIIAETITQ